MSAMNQTASRIDGVCEPEYQAVADAFAENFAHRGDVGAAVSLIVDGRKVVDLWGGSAAAGVPWKRDTLVNVWSSTKGVVALAAQMLVDQRKLDLDAPVAQYWPEFAAAGKDTVRVRHLLSHRAGLSGPRETVGINDLYDWSKMTALLADQEPWWEPGTQSGYHALTYGYLVGEVIRRVTGRRVGEVVADDIARPLGAEVMIGLDPDDMSRVARLSMDPPADGSAVAAMFAQLTPAAIAALANPSMAAPGAAEIGNDPRWQQAEIPAANGHATATGLAKVYAVLAQGGAHAGIRLLSPEGVERLREGQGRCVDLVLGAGLGGQLSEFGLGVALSGPERRYGPNPRAVGHDGYGGSFGMADPEAGIALAYVMNHMGIALADDPRKVALLDAVYEST